MELIFYIFFYIFLEIPSEQKCLGVSFEIHLSLWGLFLWEVQSDDLTCQIIWSFELCQNFIIIKLVSNLIWHHGDCTVCDVIILRPTCGSGWTAVTSGLQWTGSQRAGHSIRTGTLHTGARLPGVTVKPLRAAQLSGRLISRVTVSGLGVAAAPSAAAGLTGAEGFVCGVPAPETGWALLAELTLVSRRTATGLNPAGRDAISTPCRHQLHVVKVTTSWKDTTVQSIKIKILLQILLQLQLLFDKCMCELIVKRYQNLTQIFILRRNGEWLLRAESYCSKMSKKESAEEIWILERVGALQVLWKK